jgi:PAS domain S-box-containing protein
MNDSAASDPSPARLPPDTFDYLVEGCQLVAPDGTYLYVNEAAARQGRRTRGELLGKRMNEVYPGIDQTRMWQVLQSSMAELAPKRMENEFLYPDGSTAWFELRFVPVPDGVFVLSLDISDRIRGEEDRAHLAAAISQSGEAVVITDADGRIEYVNPAFERISGYTRDEVLGQNPRLLRSGHQGEEFYRQMWATLNAGQTWHGRMINRRKDGTTYTQDATISPVLDAAGNLVRFVGVGHDVTHELLLGQQLQQAQRMETIGRLAGGIAHDFNNILSVINANADFALEALSPDHPARADVAQIREAGDRAASLTRHLLAFSRQQMLQPELLNLNTVVTEMRDMIDRLIGEDVRCEVSLAEPLGAVRADPAQLQQVLMNLVVNARDAMPGGGTLTICTSEVDLDETYASHHLAVTPGPHVMLAVSDTGHGMDEATRLRVFEPFFTTKEQGRGTGLGLSMVYGIVKQSGGNIWVYSEPGSGTTFKIYLPLAEGTPGTASRATPETARARPGEMVLVVEDEEAVRRIAVRVLERAGFEVLQAPDGVAALELCLAHRERIRLVLTDVVMPRMGGRELAARLAEGYPHVRVLYMSGYADDAVLRNGALEPGTAFVTKPFNAATLVTKVRELLDLALP